MNEGGGNGWFIGVIVVQRYLATVEAAESRCEAAVDGVLDEFVGCYMDDVLWFGPFWVWSGFDDSAAAKPLLKFVRVAETVAAAGGAEVSVEYAR